MTGSHLTELVATLLAFEPQAPRLEAWGQRAAEVLIAGGRLLACGNGGSAEQAQHLTAELVGRYQDERRPFAALPLARDMATLTAIGNDYGVEQVFARQVRAHGRPGDLLICLSSSGTSRNVIAAAEAAAEIGLTAWALTGRGPNPLAAACADAITVDALAVCTVQEVHLAAIHIMCAAVDAAVREASAGNGAGAAGQPMARAAWAGLGGSTGITGQVQAALS
jgi:D-sedoheptulose 7-phosphate isomerase